MSLAIALVRTIGLVAALAFLVGCDDDKKDKPEYEVEILFSEDVKIEWIKMKAEREFKKPRVQVHHPGGVEVTHIEREARKKIVYDFAPLSPFAMPFSVVTMFLLYLLNTRRHYDFSPPTYQRG